jgi:hypothetical protein
LGGAGEHDQEHFEEGEQHEDDFDEREDAELRPQPDGEREERQRTGPVDCVEEADDAEEEGTACLYLFLHQVISIMTSCIDVRFISHHYITTSWGAPACSRES